MDKNKIINLKIINFFFIIIIFNFITISCLAKGFNLKNKVSDLFQKIEKKYDSPKTEIDKQADIKTNISTNTENLIASASNDINFEKYGFLKQEQVEIKLLMTQKIGKNFDSENVKFIGCQGFTTDGEYFYVAILSSGKEIDKHTKILKISIKDLKIVKEQDFGTIGHTNSLTYNSKTQKLYTAPLYKEWGGIFEFDTDLTNLKKIQLLNKDGSFIDNQQFKSVAYSKELDQYIVKYNEFTLAYFSSEFKILKTKKLKVRMALTTTQALSTDEVNLYSVTNDYNINPRVVKNNHIIIYDSNGNYIGRYVFEKKLGKGEELQQITFENGSCYAMSFWKGNFRIYQVMLRSK